MYIAIMKSRRVLCTVLSLSLACSGFPITLALAEDAAAGSGGSITIDFLDPKTEKPIPEGLLRPGDRVLLRANAHDAAGNTVTCTPSFSTIQGVSGNQIGDIKDGIMTMGSGFGSAEVVAQCAELPGVKSPPHFVANNTLITPAEKKVAAEETADKAAAAQTSSNVASDILGAAVLVGGTVVLLDYLKPKKYCGSWSCSSSQCASVMGGWSGTKEFDSMSACQYYFSGTTYGSSCSEC